MLTRRSFTSLLLPILSLGLIKLAKPKHKYWETILDTRTHQQYHCKHEFNEITCLCKKCGLSKERVIFDYSGRNNSGKWVVHKVDC